VLATHSYVETNDIPASPRADRKLASGRSNRTGSSLNADEDSVWVTQTMGAIYRDEGGLAGETIVPSLEAVLRAWI